MEFPTFRTLKTEVLKVYILTCVLFCMLDSIPCYTVELNKLIYFEIIS
jgi:hypothetical protein